MRSEQRESLPEDRASHQSAEPTPGPDAAATEVLQAATPPVKFSNLVSQQWIHLQKLSSLVRRNVQLAFGPGDPAMVRICRAPSRPHRRRRAQRMTRLRLRRCTRISTAPLSCGRSEENPVGGERRSRSSRCQASSEAVALRKP